MDTAHTVALLLGASVWPRSPALPSSPAFKKSAEAFKDFLLSPEGMSLNPDDVFWLFDDDRSVSEIDEAIGDFLQRHATSSAGDALLNIIIYYTGHGAFSEGDNRYCLTLKSTRLGHLTTSGYRVSGLARTLNQYAGDARRYVIIDACFAASALPDFIPQSDAASRIQNETLDVMAEKGTALLCAASSADVALAPRSGDFTMFSGALLEVLKQGSPTFGQDLSFGDITKLVSRSIVDKYKDQAVKPEIHIPDQRTGDISVVPIFPNAAIRTLGINARVDRLERHLSTVIDPTLRQMAKSLETLSTRLRAPEVSVAPPKSIEQELRLLPASVQVALLRNRQTQLLTLLLFGGAILTTTVLIMGGISLSLNIYGQNYQIRGTLLAAISFSAMLIIALMMRTATPYDPFEKCEGDGWRNDPLVIKTMAGSYVAVFHSLVLVSWPFYLAGGVLCTALGFIGIYFLYVVI